MIFFSSDTHYWHKRICELANRPTRLDVGVDAEYSNWAPLSFDEIKAVMAQRQYEVVDQHGAYRVDS